MRRPVRQSGPWPNSSIAKRGGFGEFPRRIPRRVEWLDGRGDRRNHWANYWVKSKQPGIPDNPAGFRPVNLETGRFTLP